MITGGRTDAIFLRGIVASTTECVSDVKLSSLIFMNGEDSFFYQAPKLDPNLQNNLQMSLYNFVNEKIDVWEIFCSIFLFSSIFAWKDLLLCCRFCTLKRQSTRRIHLSIGVFFKNLEIDCRIIVVTACKRKSLKLNTRAIGTIGWSVQTLSSFRKTLKLFWKILIIPTIHQTKAQPASIRRFQYRFTFRMRMNVTIFFVCCKRYQP